jgi:hypothetical protein
MTNELSNYLKSFVPSIANRSHDEKWVIWFPLVNYSETDGLSVDWEIRGVFNSYNAASKDFKTLTV